MSYIEKLRVLQQTFKQHGGVIGTVLQIFRTDDAKVGTLIGTDKFGNKYYQNKYYFMGRSRWVDYAPQFGFDYDGSQVPPEWHRWLHYITDAPPTVDPPVRREWMANHQENMSGTNEQYVPYSTTKPKIQAWSPGQK